MRYIFGGLVALLFFVSTQVQANTQVTFKDVWSAPSIPGSKVGVAYFKATNAHTEELSIVSAESPVSEVVELHTHQVVDDIMQMRKVDAITLPAGETVIAEPHGLHLMLIGLKEQLKEGASFPITFTLSDGTTMTAESHIHKKSDKAGAHDGHAHHSH